MDDRACLCLFLSQRKNSHSLIARNALSPQESVLNPGMEVVFMSGLERSSFSRGPVKRDLGWNRSLGDIPLKKRDAETNECLLISNACPAMRPVSPRGRSRGGAAAGLPDDGVRRA